jgi:RimJ/RimL family protein N-acetyltransferase
MSTLYTPRLILRPFTLADAKRVQELAGDIRVAQMTDLIPHPYPDGVAESWIATHAAAAEEGSEFNFAITLAGTRTPGRENDPGDTGHVIGTVCLVRGDSAEAAKLGYWIGVPYWSRGFATEAAAAALKFGFNRRGYQRVVSFHYAPNAASGRVLQKLGLTQTGTSQRFIERRNATFDLVHYAITREQWSRRQIVHRWKPAPRALTTV